jgi:hypothetical protein
MTLPEIRDPVAAGPGPGSMRAAEQALAEVSRKLADVNAELEALEREYADAHEGEAAEVTRMYLRKLGEPGRVGTVMFRLAARALGDQAEYYTVAHRELAALQPTDSHVGNTATSQLAQERQQSAAHVATRYQENSNANLASAFQAFTPMTLPTPDTSAVAPSASQGWPEGGGAAPPAAPVSIASAVPGAGATPAAPPAASGAVPRIPVDATAAGTAPAATLPGAPASAPAPGTRADAARVPAAPSALPPGVAPTPVAGFNRPSGSGPIPPLPAGDRPLLRRAPVELPSGVLGPAVPRTSGGRAPDRGGPAVPAARPEGARSAAPRTAETLPRSGEPLPRPAPGETLPRSGPGERFRAAEPLTEAGRSGAGARTASSHVPYVPGAAGGRGGEPHPRPDWLVEDDPEGVWLADVPAHGPGVLRGNPG